MEEAQSLLYQPKWRIIDQSAVGIHFPALQSFAIDDTLCNSAGSGNAPATARAWVHHNTVVLGIQDTKLPNLQEGIQLLNNLGYQVIVRNSGGLAVVLDEGVLNLSLILPESEKGIDINRGYETMRQLIQSVLSEFYSPITAKEIYGSYCPGNYDLSINGKKFAGISQRRLKKGVAVQIYLCVHGSGSDRARHIKQFYEISKQGEPTKFQAPEIIPDVMASLAELLNQNFTIPDMMLRLLKKLQTYTDDLYAGTLNDYELGLFPSYYQRIIERNEKVINS
jgi:octanoyl-[GcvH]:protein N-octanoyltransferase